MEKTELLFFVTISRDKWVVISENHRYGPFANCSDAFHDAVEQAQDAGTCGFASAVLVQSSVGNRFEVEWTYGHNPYSPGRAGSA